MIPNPQITDAERGAFLRKLNKSDLIVSPWDSEFIGNFLGCYRDWQFWTDGRRLSADNMRKLYGAEPEIEMPLPLAEHLAVSHPKADADCCMFLKRDDERRQRPCNEPAAWQQRNGFRYCTACLEAVQTDLKKRTGKTMIVFPLRPSTNPPIQKPTSP